MNKFGFLHKGVAVSAPGESASVQGFGSVDDSAFAGRVFFGFLGNVAFRVTFGFRIRHKTGRAPFQHRALRARVQELGFGPAGREMFLVLVVEEVEDLLLVPPSGPLDWDPDRAWGR